MAGIARNLRARGRRQRLVTGSLVLAVGVAGAVALLVGGAPRGARLALFVPFYVGALGLLQFRDHT
jgi:hypothetical protein